MDNEIIRQAKILIKSYNDLLRERYELYFNTEGLYDDDQNKLDDSIETAIEEWERQPFPEMGNDTPLEFVNKIGGLDTLIEIFVYIGAIETLGDTPKCLIKRIVSFGDEAAEILLDKIDIEIIEKYNYNSNRIGKEINEKFQLNISIFYIFGEKGFGGEKAINKLLEAISRCRASNELIMETISATLEERIDESRGIIIDHINNAEVIGEGDEYLLSILCETDEENKSDEIYKCLKTSFLKMSNHMMGAVFLGDYGDSRAIPAMRRFAKENLGKCSMDEYYTVLAAIEKLGGIIEDLLPLSI